MISTRLNTTYYDYGSRRAENCPVIQYIPLCRYKLNWSVSHIDLLYANRELICRSSILVELPMSIRSKIEDRSLPTPTPLRYRAWLCLSNNTTFLWTSLFMIAISTWELLHNSFSLSYASTQKVIKKQHPAFISMERTALMKSYV